MIETLELMPDCLRQSVHIQNIETVLDEMIKAVNEDIIDLYNQLNVSTATWGLDKWEDDYSLAHNVSLTYQERRERLLSTIRANNSFTEETIKNIAQTYNNCEVEVTEPSPYTCNIKFVGTHGEPNNLDLFRQALDKVKHAHVSYILEFVYNTYADLTDNTYADMAEFTYSEIKNREEES